MATRSAARVVFLFHTLKINTIYVADKSILGFRLFIQINLAGLIIFVYITYILRIAVSESKEDYIKGNQAIKIYGNCALIIWILVHDAQRFYHGVRENRSREDLKLRNRFIYTVTLGLRRITAISLRSLSKNHIAVFGVQVLSDTITPPELYIEDFYDFSISHLS